MTELIGRASEEAVVQYWLKREYHGRAEVTLFLEKAYPQMIRLVELEDFGNKESNAGRLRMLTDPQYRWWFNDFRPGGNWAASEWNRITLHQEDIQRLLLINAGDRREMSGGTLSPLDAAKNILNGVTFPPEVQTDADDINRNSEVLALDKSRIVVIGPRSGPLTVVDGVHRITGYCLHYLVRKLGRPEDREAYHGVSRRPYDRRFGPEYRIRQ